MNEPYLKLLLKKDSLSKNSLFAPLTCFKQWVVEQTFPSQLSFGSKTVFCNVLPNPDNKEEWLLSSDLWEVLSIPYEAPIRVYQKEQMLHLGPLIGIFTAGFTENPQRPLGERSNLFANYLTLTTNIGGYFFLFGAHQINWESGKIDGVFHTSNRWETFSTPFPHVVYDRLPNRRTEQLSVSQEVKSRMQKHYLIPWFNSGFFNKWTVYDTLKNDRETKKFLPETVVHPTLDDIGDLLVKYRHVFIKPANGSLGLGVHQIIKRDSDPCYYCRFRDQETNKLRRFSDLQRLLYRQFGTYQLKSMIVQQGIDLVKMEGRPLDFRIHANKDGKGKWQISAIAAKISGENSVTTHINSGGIVKTISELHFEDDALNNALHKLADTALAISKTLDENTEGFIGEIGFDMGIDKRGHIWMFEANSKPGRSIFSHPGLKDEDIATRKLPLEYAVYLAETSLVRPALVLT